MEKMSGNKKIFCIGSNLESYKCLKFLVERKCKIDTLITLPAGKNDNVSDYFDLHNFCFENGIKTIDTTNVNDAETIAKIEKEAPDYLFTLGWSQIFKKQFILAFKEAVVGTHPSKLPYGRGRAPVPWTILEDLDKTAVSFFKIDLGIDTGKLILQKMIPLPNRPYAMDLYNLIAKNLGTGFLELYNKIINNEAFTFNVQSSRGVTLRGKRSVNDGLINFNSNVEDIDKLIRAVSEPFPGAYCYYKDNKIIFWEVELNKNQSYFGTLGQILKKSNSGILVQAANGTLWLKKPTNNYKESIKIDFFKVGDKLGYNVQDQIYLLRKKLC